MKLYHEKHGELTPAEKKYNPLGNKVEQLYADQIGGRHTLDGTEKPMEEMEKQHEDTQVKEQTNQKDQKIQEMSDDMEFEKNLAEYDQKEADSEEKIRNHTELLEAVKNAPTAIVEAVNAIPKTVIPEIKIPDHFEEEKKWQAQVLEVLRKEINLPETNFEPVVKAIEKIKFPEFPKIPEPKDYTKILKAIKDSLPDNTDLSLVEKLLSEIKPFEIPEKLLTKDGSRLKVEVDRISLGGGGGSIDTSTLATEETLQAVKTTLETLDVTINAGDIEIGAVEIKNSTDDTRATVGANGLYVDVRTSALPTGASTLAQQDKLAKYRAADVDADASPNYYGFVDLSGNWFILKETISAGADTYRYIAGTTGYTTNWTGRAGLSYDYLYNITIV